jgi:branched-subunit amino acid aminotransferase/4-amino-4-deoxychorismate lyase
MKVSLNGSIVDSGKAFIQAESDGLFYGAGCFETFASYRGKFLHLNRHMERLNHALNYLTGGKAEPFSEERLRSEIATLLEANRLNSERSKIRLQVSLSGRAGYSQTYPENPKLIAFMTAEKISERPPDQMSLATVETTVVPASCRPTHLKLSNMMHYRQASVDAKAMGADDALMFTVAGNVAETSIANIWWEKNGTVFTPSAACDILPGITRSVLIDVCSQMDIEINEGAYSASDIKDASQVWICNSIKEIAWVSTIDGRSYPSKTLLRDRILHHFDIFKRENLK